MDSGVGVLRVPCLDRRGEDIFEVNLLREFENNYLMTPEKIRDLWAEFMHHRVLFSDDTEGKFRPFFIILMDPRGVWLEIVRASEPDRPVGVGYITSVKPGHEAEGHFAFWDSGGRGREPVVLFMVEWVMDRYSLHRINASVPVYQRGTMSFIERLGFVREGVRREAVVHNGIRQPLVLFGITRDEVESKLQNIWGEEDERLSAG